ESPEPESGKRSVRLGIDLLDALDDLAENRATHARANPNVICLQIFVERLTGPAGAWVRSGPRGPRHVSAGQRNFQITAVGKLIFEIAGVHFERESDLAQIREATGLLRFAFGRSQ